MITFVKDIDLIDHVEEYDVVMIGTNILQTMGNGFQDKISRKYPELFKAVLTTRYGDPKMLGNILYLTIDKTIYCICFINRTNNSRPDLYNDYLDYTALETCLKKINTEFKGKRLVSTMIGCSKWDGNGNSERVIELITENLTDLDVTLYDYEQIPRAEEHRRSYREVLKYKETDPKKFYKLYGELKVKRNEQSKVRNHGGQQKANKQFSAKNTR